MESLCLTSLNNNEHYLRAVGRMAAHQEVVIGHPIQTQDGTTLLHRGDVVGGDFYELLRDHPLPVSPDRFLLAEKVVDIPTLETQVMYQCASQPLGQQLVSALQGVQPLLDPLRRMAWPHQASFKMTVMRDQLPELFEHSVLMMMVSVYLAIRSGMPLPMQTSAAAAALLHDVGMLYLPLRWSDAGHRLSMKEHRLLTTHPIISMQVVQEMKGFGPDVENAIAEHHERLDGSGYPEELSAPAISPLGEVLLLAEVVSAIYAKFQDNPGSRLSLMLRINQHRFPPALTRHIFSFLPAEPATGADHAHYSMADMRAGIAALSAIYQKWTACKKRFPANWQDLPESQTCLYADETLAQLERTLAQAGLHPHQQADWSTILANDPVSMTEIMLTLREALWEISTCAKTIADRWPHLLCPTTEADQAMYDWIDTVNTAQNSRPLQL